MSQDAFSPNFSPSNSPVSTLPNGKIDFDEQESNSNFQRDDFEIKTEKEEHHLIGEVDEAPAPASERSFSKNNDAVTLANNREPSYSNENRSHPSTDHNVANSDENKIFIGGLGWDTTEAMLRDHFSTYGRINHVVIMRDPLTGKSRGFGFVQFIERHMAEEALKFKHQISGKQVEAKQAIPKDSVVTMPNKPCKIFVSGILHVRSDQELSDFFQKFGKVCGSMLMFDKLTGQPRGFGFVTFERTESVDAVMAEPEIIFQGKPIEVKVALPKTVVHSGRLGTVRSDPRMNYNSDRPRDHYGYDQPPMRQYDSYVPTTYRPQPPNAPRYAPNGFYDRGDSYNASYDYLDQPPVAPTRYAPSRDPYTHADQLGYNPRPRSYQRPYPAEEYSRMPGHSYMATVNGARNRHSQYSVPRGHYGQGRGGYHPYQRQPYP